MLLNIDIPLNAHRKTEHHVQHALNAIALFAVQRVPILVRFAAQNRLRYPDLCPSDQLVHLKTALIVNLHVDGVHTGRQLTVHDAIPARILTAIRIGLRFVHKMTDPNAHVRIHARQAIVAHQFRLSDSDAQAPDDIRCHVRSGSCGQSLMVLMVLLLLVQSVSGLTIGGFLEVARRRDA